MELNELIESVRAEEASYAALFGGDGTGARSRPNRQNPVYLKKLAEAAELIKRVGEGNARAALIFNEAMSTSDFPVLFGDILDRQVLANYKEAPASWSAYVHRSLVRDFRLVRRMKLEGGEGVLAEVKQQGEYEERGLTDGAFGYQVKKYGARLPLAWESLVNDDLDTFRDIPARFGRAARRSEEKFATQLFVGANGPLASFFSVGNGNIITGNPALSLQAFQAAMTLLSQAKDSDGEPIVIESVVLVVPPALEIIANNIVNATQIELNSNGGDSTQRLIAPNWMQGRVKVVVNYYIPIVASAGNGNTSWFLFASPSNGRPAIEMGFLRGHEQPEMFMKGPNATRIGGGTVAEDFDNDSINYKVRHVFGGGTQDPKMAIGSNGSGS